MLSRADYSLSAILRMPIQLDRDEKTDLRRALDTPRSNEDVYMASDRWISTFTDQERRTYTIIALVEETIQKQTTGNCGPFHPPALKTLPLHTRVIESIWRQHILRLQSI